MTEHQNCQLDDCTTRHNHCDFCHKDFRTAIGFHRHYPMCGNKHNWKRNLGWT